MRATDGGAQVNRGVTHTTSSAAALVHSVAPGDVTLLDGLWLQRVAANRTSGIPMLFERLEEHGVIDNFRRRSGKPVDRRGFWFTDSDLYKWMEAAAWSLSAGEDSGVAGMLDAAIEAVIGAQDADGYLNTNFEPDSRFPDLSWSHELYCAGHLFQAAVADHRATGRTDLLDAAARLADFLCSEFGPGHREERDHHPEVETALIELHRETGTARYLDLAEFFLGLQPYRDWQELWGHAVCALYYASGLTDLAVETGDPEIRAALEQLWESMVGEKSYVTGGVGGRWVSESFGRAYELPNEGAYAETCGGVAAVHWAWRMLTLTGESRYADQLELALHNAFLAGVSLSADEWFYANPLATRAGAEEHPFIGEKLPEQIAGPFPLRRRRWRDVTCCPPNANRLLASLTGYLYGWDADGLWVHMYAASRVRAAGFSLLVGSEMPWDGEVVIEVEAVPEGEASIVLRIPGWSNAPKATVNGEGVPGVAPGSYLRLRRDWAIGDRVALALGMEPGLVECNPRVMENRGSVAVRRGPLVYCLEGHDNPGVDVLDVAVAQGVALRAEHRPDLLGGVTVIAGTGAVPSEPWTGGLYRPAGRSRSQDGDAWRDVTLAAIPYYAWANRGLAPMTVWLRLRE